MPGGDGCVSLGGVSVRVVRDRGDGDVSLAWCWREMRVRWGGILSWGWSLARVVGGWVAWWLAGEGRVCRKGVRVSGFCLSGG